MSDVTYVEYRPGRPVPVRAILAPMHRGQGDPSVRFGPGAVAWASHTPAGPVTSVWLSRADGADVYLTGPGSAWLAPRVPQVLGAEDDPSGFAPHHPVLARAYRQPEHQHWRVPKTGLTMASLIPSVLEQKVTGKQAFGGYRTLVRAYGSPAVSASALATELFDRGVLAMIGAERHFALGISQLITPPDVTIWRHIPSWAWLRAQVEPPQSRTIMRALEVAHALEECGSVPIPLAHRRLRSVPGIGIWTAAKVAQLAWGDADAPTFADYHVAKDIGHALFGHDIDDAAMARVLNPYRPHRFRAERLICCVAGTRERHGARMALPAHLGKM